MPMRDDERELEERIEQILPGEEEEEAPPQMYAMQEEELAQIVREEIAEARIAQDSTIADRRLKARQYYDGAAFGDGLEIEGRSQVVLRDVADTVNWIVPQLMKMFFGGAEFVEYRPETKGDEPGCEQATEYVNHVWENEVPGFRLCLDAFKTALTEDSGIFKVWTEERAEPRFVWYYGQTEEQVHAILTAENTGAELVNVIDAGELELPPLVQMNPQTGEPEEIPQAPLPLFDIEVRYVKRECKLCVRVIPPENFLVAPRQERVDNTIPFCGDEDEYTKGELIALGFDPEVVNALQSDDTPDYDENRVDRYEDEDGAGLNRNRRDVAMQKVWVTDCYIRVDRDGDGIPELLRVVMAGGSQGAGGTILLAEAAADVPYALLCPDPRPFRVFGDSVASRVMDLQLIRSILVRNILDNVYALNNGRYEAVEGMVELDDLLTSTPAGVVRTKAPGMVKALDTPEIGRAPMELLDFFDGVRENRTGMSRASMGLDASTLRNTTATGIGQLMTMAQVHVDFIARVFAEDGMKRLFQLMLRALVRSGMQEKLVKLKGTWTPIDPSRWSEGYGARVVVGLGPGQQQERIQHLQAILETQVLAFDKGFGNYLVTAKNVYNAVGDWTHAMGFRAKDRFFSNPDESQPPPEKPDPNMVVAQAQAKKVEVEAQTEAARVQETAQYHQAELMLKVREHEDKMALEREKIASEERVAFARIAVEREKAQADAAAKRAEKRKPKPKEAA